MNIVAQYVDCSGNTFSCGVTKVGNDFMLATQHGPRPISYYIQGDDLAGGYAAFHDYALRDIPKGMRGCDVIAAENNFRRQLPWPTAPANPPQANTEPEDTRLHVDTVAPGENALRVLQSAGGPAFARQLAERERARRQAQITQPSPYIQELSNVARSFRNQYANKNHRG